MAEGFFEIESKGRRALACPPSFIFIILMYKWLGVEGLYHD